MFNLFRSREKSVRIMLGVLLLLVAVAMLMYLVPSGPTTGVNQGDDVIAQIGDDKVTIEDVNRDVEAYRMRRVPEAQIVQLVPAVINSLMWERAMAYKAKEMGMTVSEQQIADLIDLQLGKGQPLNPADYQAMVTQIGMTVPQYEHDMGESYLAQQMAALDQKSMPASEEAAKAYYHRFNDKVSVDWVKFESAPFYEKSNKMAIDPAVLKAYFEKNRAYYIDPEARTFDVIVAEASHFIGAAKVSDATIAGLYSSNLDSYRIPERVNVRQILIKTQDMPKDDIPKLKAKAEDVLNQLKKGANFADLAKKYSDDKGTASRGGDIGWVVRGQIAEQEFENAAFSMTPGSIGEIVQSRYGFHIVQVLAHEAARTRSLDEVRGELMAEAQKEQGDKDLAAAIADCRAEIVRTPQQDESIAAKYGLAFHHVDKWTPRDSLPSLGGIELALSPAISETPKGGVSNIADSPKTGDQGFVVMDNIIPAHPSDFATAEKDLEKRYRADQGAKDFKAWVAEAADRVIKKKESLESVAKAMHGITGTFQPFTINGALEGIGRASALKAAFKMKPGDTFGPVEGKTADFIFAVKEVLPANDFTPDQRRAATAALEDKDGQFSPLYEDSVLQDLKRRGIAKVNEAVIRRLIASFRTS